MVYAVVPNSVDNGFNVSLIDVSSHRASDGLYRMRRGQVAFAPEGSASPDWLSFSSVSSAVQLAGRGCWPGKSEKQPNWKIQQGIKELIMSDTREKTSAETPARGRATAETAKTSETSQVGGAATEQSGPNSADTLRQGGRAAAETIHHLSKVAEDGTHRGMQLFAEAQQKFMRSMADQLEQTRHEMAEAAQTAAQDLRMLMVRPNVVGANLHDLRQGMISLFEGLIRTNIGAAQQQMRLADVGAFFRLQQQSMHNYMDALIQGSAILTRSTRTAADRALGALEQQLDYRLHARVEGQRQQSQSAAK
jgi:hypothetical protein